MSKPKSKSHDLPSKRNAPRKSGKRGIKPLDEGDELLTTPATGKQGRLPTMEDAHIEALEDCAREYANLRDDRMRLLTKEIEQKEILHAMMTKYDKKVYRVSDMEITVVQKDETVRVKLLNKEKD